MFDTLKARDDAIRGEFIYGGLAQAFKELWDLESEEAAQKRLDDFGPDHLTWKIYELAQQLSAPKIFVDKT